MKTDRFDDEFRRKLLGLPADTDPGEVDRIHTYIRTHSPGIPGAGWGKLGLFGGVGLLLVASLTYNFIQSYRNTHLQSSLDSLTQRSAQVEKVGQHDTVYVAQQSVKQANGSGFHATNATPSVDHESGDRLLTGQPKRYSGQDVMERLPRSSSQADEPSHQPVRTGQRIESLAKTDSPGAVTNPAGDRAVSVDDSSARALAKTSEPWRVDRKKRLTNPGTSPTNDDLVRSDESVTSSDKGTYSGQAKERAGRLLSQRSVVANQAPDDKLALNAATDTRRGRINASENTNDRTTTSANEKIASESALENSRQDIVYERLSNRQMDKTSTLSEIISPKRLQILPVNQAVIQKTRRSWHLTLPTLSVPNAEYRIGGLVVGADDQVGGGLLGEVTLNRHWSLQAGVRVLYSQGFRYRDERDYNDHQQENFRQKYASGVSLTADIEDIRQAALIAQVPIQLAYHYPLSQQWRLRLGIGTDLDLWVRSAIRYKHQENSRSSEEELTRVKTSAQLVNNLTLSPSVEWYRKKWVFRGGPFISPQLRSVSYKPEHLSWGATVQVLYRLGN